MPSSFVWVPSLHTYRTIGEIILLYISAFAFIREPFEKFVHWRQCAAVMQRDAVTVMPSCSGGGNVVVA
jgi:hypothetical protein